MYKYPRDQAAMVANFLARELEDRLANSLKQKGISNNEARVMAKDRVQDIINRRPK